VATAAAAVATATLALVASLGGKLPPTLRDLGVFSATPRLDRLSRLMAPRF